MIDWLTKFLLPAPKKLPPHFAILCLNCCEHMDKVRDAYECPKCYVTVAVVVR